MKQPGHEYTKANVQFAASILQTEPIMKLMSFAENNKETQGKFTIGDEKVSQLEICGGQFRMLTAFQKHNVFMMLEVCLYKCSYAT